MGRGSGIGLAILAGILLLVMKPRELTALDFSGAFQPPIYSPTYSQYYSYVTKPEDELAEGEEFVTMPHPVLDRPPGRWLTINGRIPTPSGTTIPLPTVHVGRVKVEEMLQPIEEATEEPHFQDVAGRRSVNLRLKPL